MQSKMFRSPVQRLIAIALLAGCYVVISRFLGVVTWNLKFSFSFITVVMAAWLFGPLDAALVAGIGDFVGAMAFPAGAYFPPITLSAALSGVCYGLFLHRQNSFVRVLLAVVVNQLLSLFLTTLWISILSGSPYLALLATRSIQVAAMTVVQLVTIPVILMAAKRIAPVIRV